MVACHVDTFASAAVDAGCDVTRTSADGFTTTLSTVVEAPAVGTPLPYTDTSYEGTPVDTAATPDGLRGARTGVTAARSAIADYGSLVLEASGAGEELVSIYPDRHVAVVAASDVVPDMPSAIDGIAEVARGTGDAIIATGPSATADMGAVVTGVHGPQTVHVVILGDR